MRITLAILLLCSVAYAQKPPKTAGMKQVAGRTPSSAFVPDEQLPPRQPSALMLGGGVYPQRPLTDKEYKEQKRRYSEWLVHQRAAARAGISSKGGKRSRSSNISVHDDYQNAAMEAVRQVQGR